MATTHSATVSHFLRLLILSLSGIPLLSGQTTATLTWTAVPNATYTVLRAPSPCTTYSTIASGLTTASYTDTSYTSGSCYQVTAISAATGLSVSVVTQTTQTQTAMCDADVLFPWTGGVSGQQITTASLKAGTMGGTGSWSIYGKPESFSTTAYGPLGTPESCLYGSTNWQSGVGIAYNTSLGPNAVAVYYFNPVSTASALTCFSTNIPANDPGGPDDMFAIYAYTGTGKKIDYVNTGVWPNGKLTIFGEFGSGTIWNSGITIQGEPRQYALGLVFVQGGNHQIEVFDGCQSGAALLGTISKASVVGGDAANQLFLGNGGALTSTPNLIWTYGGTKLNYTTGQPLTN